MTYFKVQSSDKDREKMLSCACVLTAIWTIPYFQALSKFLVFSNNEYQVISLTTSESCDYNILQVGIINLLHNT